MTKETELLPCHSCGKMPRVTPEGEIYCCISKAKLPSAWNTRAQPAIPDTHVLMPKEPDADVMCRIASGLYEQSGYLFDPDDVLEILSGGYEKLVEAAQKEQGHG